VEVEKMAKSLMIVDDSLTMRRIIMRTVRMSGVEFERTEEAGNGLEALAKLKQAPVDVVLCDINMPEMNGIEMVKKLRTEMPERAGTKVIMVSTESSPELMNSVLADGANGFINKPFTPEAFAEKLRPLLN
jgi:two-component system, chemotaxis family, chemotaxis protein CheY